MAGPNRFYEEITSEHVKILCTIGHGAFGTIYQARHRDWGIDVAIKILNCNTNFTQKELLNEARTMDEARFIYVLRLFGLFVGHVPGRSGTAPDLGLVMEYMENGSLYALKNKVSPVPWALRVRILHEVALGMNFLHSLSPPLLHLDLKPSNVLLDGDFHVRVADFGLSKVKRASVQKVTHDSASGDEYGYGGTLEFMPPEAFTDVNYKPSTSADVYSYGILMWSVLTEEEPYQHVHPGILSTQIRSLIPKGQRPNTKDLENKISHILKLEDLIHLMKRCWHNDRTRRPSFRDCSQETESIYLCFKPHIVSAVRQVQDILVQRESKVSNNTGGTSGRTLPGGISIPQFGTSPHQPPLASPSTFEEHFMTMRLEEPPSRQNEAVPPGEHFRTNQERRPAALHRSYSDWNTAELTENEKPQTEGVMFRTGTRPAGSRRPRSDTFVSPPYLGYQQYFPYWSGDPHESDPGFMRWSHSFLPHFHRRASQGHGEINFSGSDIRGMQIGNQNVMRLERLSQEKDKE